MRGRSEEEVIRRKGGVKGGGGEEEEVIRRKGGVKGEEVRRRK